MESRAVRTFWDRYHALTPEIRRLADKQYRLWVRNPNHPSLRFKKVGDYWSARINDDFRAVGVMDGGAVVWFFIGSHAEYDRLLKES